MSPSRHYSPSRRLGRVARRGVSLFEIMLALVILGITLAALAPFESRATRVALRNRLETEAQLRALALLHESVARGNVQPRGRQTCDDDPRWSYCVEVSPTEARELLVVRIVIERRTEHDSGRVSTSVSQLIRRELIEPRHAQSRRS